jgi:hypothetical protein
MFTENYRLTILCYLATDVQLKFNVTKFRFLLHRTGQRYANGCHSSLPTTRRGSECNYGYILIKTGVFSASCFVHSDQCSVSSNHCQWVGFEVTVKRNDFPLFSQHSPKQ